MDEVMSCLSFYNYKRLHYTVRYVSPMDYGKGWCADSEKDVA